MATVPKILCFAGSLRKDSLNKRLVKIAMAGARKAGAEVTFIDLRDYPLPVYDGDMEEEQGIPENAKKLKTLLKEHQGLLIASPEYNSSISGALKNAIDWASRKGPDEKPLECYTGKVAGIMAASPGALGGLRGLASVRSILQNIGVLVVPDQVALPGAADAFDENGNLKDQKRHSSVESIGKKVAELLHKLHA
ncbi:MAG: NAD(P)H-dependent oxidoreductase [Candidatus Obscuribacterales bacterium]|nr:NAD(P)H-dependent oxidoreductase [Candidatus Obscuribacterales bacterium]